MTRVELSSDLDQWEAFEAKHLFFDIDDTLNAHGQGLTEAICRWLDSHVDRGKTVVLLTNCSERRALQHQENLNIYACRATLWPVGGKPDVKWLLASVSLKHWVPSDCAMIGDRPTMDMWMAKGAGFSERVWVKGWGAHRSSIAPLAWIQNIEWALLR